MDRTGLRIVEGLDWAFDTETISGKAALLALGNSLGKNEAWDIRETSLSSILEHLLAYSTSLPADSVGWAYNLDYDILAILKHGPLALIENFVYKPEQNFRGWRLTWLPGKFFAAERKGKKLEVFDLYPFYQSSLDIAARKILGLKKFNLDVRGGVERYFRSRKAFEKLSRYARRDATLTARLGQKIREAFAKEEIYPNAWYSPGFVAKGILQETHVCQPFPTWIQQLAARAYYGGRIEALQRGWFKKVYAADIRSAYPDAIRKLPCFCDAKVRYADGPPPQDSDYYLAKVRVSSPRKTIVGAFPLRRKNRPIIYPCGTFTTWATQPEIEVGKKLGWRIKFEKTLAFRLPNRDVRPWRIVANWFRRRSKSPEASIAWKLVLNSLYGIFAERRVVWKPLDESNEKLNDYHEQIQRQTLRLRTNREIACQRHKPPEPKVCGRCAIARTVEKSLRGPTPPSVVVTRNGVLGKSTEPGRVANLVAAGWVTGYVRARLVNECLKKENCKHVIALATDGVYSSQPLRLRYGSSLGSWKREEDGTDGLFVAGGVYEYSTKNGIVSKHRGFRGIRGKIRDAARKAKNGRLSFQVLEHQSPSLLLDRGLSLVSVNELLERERSLNLESDQKRLWPKNFPKKGSQSSNPIFLKD